ncbi:MAG: hypothetical protein KAY37_12535 [Phycisphaerae bacterium]|nr:hypothetical protein [Phycisphaerae bacterium]
MYPIESSNVPAIGAGYVPYFYQAGLHQLYALPSPNPAEQSHESPHGLSGADASASPFELADRIQTIEDVIVRGYFSVPESDPVTATISDRELTSRLGLDDVISQIRRRYEIHDENLVQMELGKCAAINAIYQHKAYAGPPNSKQTYAKHKAIQDLYEEERCERTALWKDVSRLRLQFPESAQQYLSAHRKASILDDDPGGAP